MLNILYTTIIGYCADFPFITSSFFQIISEGNPTAYVKRLQCMDNQYWSTISKGSICNRSANTKAIRMYFTIVLCVLAISLDTTFSHPIDDVILQFIANATPILFSPSRISLHTCINYGKIFEFIIYILTFYTF